MESLVCDAPEAGCVLFLPGLPGGGGCIHDRTAYGNLGTITGAIWTRLASGQFCLTFDGVDDIVRCQDADCLDIVDNISIVAWIKRSGLSYRDFIVAKREGGAGNASYQFEVANDVGHIDTLYFSYQDSGGNWEANVYSQGTIGTGWHQAAVTRSLRKIRFFIDGKPDPNEYVPARNMDVKNSHYLGIGAVTGLANMAGSLARVRIYGRALTALELQDLFRRESPLFGVW
jgi:hypothetical protein